MQVDIEVLAQRASVALSNQQAGFIGCHVESAANRVLAYTFTDDVSAHQFQQQRALLGLRAVIANANPRVVLVTHD